jgi:hypothetical protein
MHEHAYMAARSLTTETVAQKNTRSSPRAKPNNPGLFKAVGSRQPRISEALLSCPNTCLFKPARQRREYDVEPEWLMRAQSSGRRSQLSTSHLPHWSSRIFTAGGSVYTHTCALNLPYLVAVGQRCVHTRSADQVL